MFLTPTVQQFSDFSDIDMITAHKFKCNNFKLLLAKSGASDSNFMDLEDDKFTYFFQITDLLFLFFFVNFFL